MEANTIDGLYLYSVFTNPMFLSTNNLSIVYIFPENISLFPLISVFVLYLILRAFTNQITTVRKVIYKEICKISNFNPTIKCYMHKSDSMLENEAENSLEF